MKIQSITLPRSQRFASRVKPIKAVFGQDELIWVSLGHPIRSYRFDSALTSRPRLKGPVVASITVTRDNAGHLCLYPVARSDYPDSAAEEFEAEILPQLAAWRRTLANRPATAALGHEQKIVEWRDPEHETHHVHFR